MKNENKTNEKTYDLLIRNAVILPSFEDGSMIRDGIIGIRDRADSQGSCRRNQSFSWYGRSGK